jgi:hypothetical protein
MAVTIYMPDGTVKVLGKQSPTTGTAKKTVGPVTEQRKSSPSTGARILKQALDRLDQVDLHANQRKEAAKKPAHSR